MTKHQSPEIDAEYIHANILVTPTKLYCIQCQEEVPALPELPHEGENWESDAAYDIRLVSFYRPHYLEHQREERGRRMGIIMLVWFCIAFWLAVYLFVKYVA